MNELNHFEIFNSVCGRLGTSAALIAELRGLLEKEPVLDRAARRLSIRGAHHPTPSTSNGLLRSVRNVGIEVVEPDLPLVTRASGLDDHEPGREAPVLDGIRVRQHRDRIDRIVGQRDLRQARRWVGEACPSRAARPPDSGVRL